MELSFGRVVVFLAALLVGYCAGFEDAQTHDHTVFRRIVQRVQTFGERTVGEPARDREEAAERVGQ